MTNEMKQEVLANLNREIDQLLNIMGGERSIDRFKRNLERYEELNAERVSLLKELGAFTEGDE